MQAKQKHKPARDLWAAVHPDAASCRQHPRRRRFGVCAKTCPTETSKPKKKNVMSSRTSAITNLTTKQPARPTTRGTSLWPAQVARLNWPKRRKEPHNQHPPANVNPASLPAPPARRHHLRRRPLAVGATTYLVQTGKPKATVLHERSGTATNRNNRPTTSANNTVTIARTNPSGEFERAQGMTLLAISSVVLATHMNSSTCRPCRHSRSVSGKSSLRNVQPKNDAQSIK